ncbi:pentapeptide repeat-containing protein [Streptomyces justiciae]|uniref:pentapeptide repeat-containing protein n=1 Tax=Streptomyces justiciae TaxID=2780140 RepID=UPI00187FC56B|nr:pentapeptide repeat-containing protein [Streptomyces justiciae]MBE8476037.1 pentapeptide repeat-containing protein [Streptomyces justiciae]
MTTPLSSVPPAPSWPHCGHEADPAGDPVGCRGIHVPGHTFCLAHLPDADRTTYLAGLTPGAEIDCRGTPFTTPLLNALRSALHDAATGNDHFGRARFDGAEFSGGAAFDGVQFSGRTSFNGAQFSGRTSFREAQFSNDATFDAVRFISEARFSRVEFSSSAAFEHAEFSGDVGFEEAQFLGDAWFNRAQFSGRTRFDQVRFADRAGFTGAQFSGATWFGRAQFSRTTSFGRVRFSDDARFDRAQFSDHARFDEAQFCGDAGFGEVQFSGDTGFDRAQFSGTAWFDGARFAGNAWFSEGQFVGRTSFDRARFSGDAAFGQTRFSSLAQFTEAQFSGPAGFSGAQFSGDALFYRARFEGVPVMGPLVCAGRVSLDAAVFTLPVTLEMAARNVSCGRTSWESTATVRLRYAAVDLSHSVLAAPVAITVHAAEFTTARGPLPETLLSSPSDADPTHVRITSVQGADAAYLVLTDTDLTDCLFSGAFHLDQLRLEGRTTFASTPAGLHRRGPWPVRWTRRRTLAEEHHWRAQYAGQAAPSSGAAGSPGQWRAGPHHLDPARTPGPEGVAALYRQLRKAFEDAKNEPGAADFYYGECEMRRHDITGTPKGERRLLWAYWLLSGYGLRASRAFGWLLAAMSLTVLLLMGVGLPTHDPDPATTGTLHGNRISLHTSSPDPALHGGWRQRMTWARAEKATRVAINSVVFRSSGQNLTPVGTYIEMASRLFEPTLLALGALAVRGRIKR